MYAIRKISTQTKWRPRYVVCGLIVLGILLLLIPYTRGVMKAVTTFFVPAYKTFKALESPTKEDDRRWLTYWVVYGFLGCFDNFLVSALRFIPLFDLFRVLLLNFLHLSKEQGSLYLYTKFIAPTFEYISSILAPTVLSIDTILFQQLINAKTN